MLDDKDIEKLTDVFVTKDEFKDELEKLATKEDINGLSTGQDEILEKLNLLLGEKTVNDEQDKRQKKILEIHNTALKRGKILSEQETAEVDSLQIF